MKLTSSGSSLSAEGLDVKTDRSVSIEIFSPFVRDQYFYVMLIICYANDVDLFN